MSKRTQRTSDSSIQEQICIEDKLYHYQDTISQSYPELIADLETTTKQWMQIWECFAKTKYSWPKIERSTNYVDAIG